MRSLLVALALLTGCELRPEPRVAAFRASAPVSRPDTARSVYKVNAQIKLERSDGKKATKQWTGTGWVVSRVGQQDLVMTAAHVCDFGPSSYPEVDEFKQPTGLTIRLASGMLELESAEGAFYPDATVVLSDARIDLCVLAVRAHLGPALPLADADPEYGDRGWYVGAPHGIWGGGFAGIYEITFSGRAKPFDVEAMVFTSAEGAPGASGSPMLIGGRVVAILNRGVTGFGTIAEGVPWDVAREFLAAAEKHL